MKRLALAIATMSLALAAPAMADPWPPLDMQSAKDMRAALDGQPAAKLTMVCATDDCRRLASDIRSVFLASGWDVRSITHGGIGIDGIQGIRVVSCSEQAGAIGRFLYQHSSQRVDIKDDGPCAQDRSIYLIIGTLEH